MDLTSFLANKCFEFLLNAHCERDGRQDGDAPLAGSQNTSAAPFFLPPWVKDVQSLRMNCDGCGNCLARCESTILVLDDDGYPRVDFSKGSCTFCRACVESCSRDVFERDETAIPWTLKARITGDCLCHNNVLCRTCLEYCEYGAIVFATRSGAISVPKIAAESCTGCGACFVPCPVRAISIIDTVENEQP